MLLPGRTVRKAALQAYGGPIPLRIAYTVSGTDCARLYQMIDGVTYTSFRYRLVSPYASKRPVRGDNVNSFDLSGREPDPERLLQGYFHSAATLNYARTALPITLRLSYAVQDTDVLVVGYRAELYAIRGTDAGRGTSILCLHVRWILAYNMLLSVAYCDTIWCNQPTSTASGPQCRVCTNQRTVIEYGHRAWSCETPTLTLTQNPKP
eukprot:3941705-Rhodomonas_salina.6